MKTCHFSICRMLPQFPNLLKSKINPSKKKNMEITSLRYKHYMTEVTLQRAACTCFYWLY